ncbi:MAG TPA: alpha/beta fold hydrolase [Thermoanaerobaculia bacterium]|nr:alpha/beta fold hydrolase [Thermoanaerobaculia bacterium]
MPSGNHATAVPSLQKSTTDRLRPAQVPGWFRAGFRVAGALAPGAAAGLARRLFFTPPRAAMRPEERAVLERGERFEVAAGGQRVVGRAWGEGPTVLLVHGWGGHSGQMTALVEPAVAAGFRAVAIDLPGHGESAGGMSSLVHFATALERAAALWKPVAGLVAHSFGAAASTYAMSRGLAVRRAVFFAPPARFDSFWTRFRTGVGVSDEVWRRLMRAAESWLQVRFDGIAPLDLAPAMAVPLLVLHDAGDREMSFGEGTELVGRWPGAVLCRTEGLGHLRILRDERCVAAAVRFLQG